MQPPDSIGFIIIVFTVILYVIGYIFYSIGKKEGEKNILNTIDFVGRKTKMIEPDGMNEKTLHLAFFGNRYYIIRKEDKKTDS